MFGAWIISVRSLDPNPIQTWTDCGGKDDQQTQFSWVLIRVIGVRMISVRVFASLVVGSDQASDPKRRSDPPFPGLGSLSDLIHH